MSLVIKTLGDFFSSFMLKLLAKSILLPLLIGSLIFAQTKDALADLLQTWGEQGLSLASDSWVLGFLTTLVPWLMFFTLVYLVILLMLDFYAESLVRWVNQKHYGIALHPSGQPWWMDIGANLLDFFKYLLLVSVTWPLLWVPLVNLLVPLIWQVALTRKPLLRASLSPFVGQNDMPQAMMQLQRPSRGWMLASSPLMWTGVFTLFMPFLQMILLSHLSLRYLAQQPNEDFKEQPMIQIIHQPSDNQLTQLGVRQWPIWEKEISQFPWFYDTEETCYILEGEVWVTPEGQSPQKIKQGDLVVFAQGLQCTWDIRQPIRKHYRFA